MNTYFKKTLLSFIVLLTALAPLAPTLKLKEVKAITVYVAGGYLNAVQSIPSLEAPANVTAGATSNIAGQQKLEYIEEFALSALKRQLLNRIVDDIITWINGGGEPRFVTDWEGFLSDAANMAAGSVVEDLGLGFLCSPFSAQLQIVVAANQRRQYTDTITCTLDQVVGNIERFYNDFSQGGWIGYYESWEPQNNFFGAYLITQEEANRRAFRAEQAAQNEALAGGGVLSTKDCEENPATANLPSAGPDIDGDGNYGDRDCEITTPGSVIQDLLGKAIGVDIDLILQSEQLPDYVADIANALINRIIREGVNGLRGLTTRSNPGNDFVPSNSTSTFCEGLEGEVLAACLSYQGVVEVSFENSRQEIEDEINEALSYRRAALTTLESMLSLWKEHILALEDKPSCSEAEDFTEIANEEVSFLETRIAVETKNIEDLEAALTTLESLDSDAWKDLIDIQREIAGTADPASAKAFSERVARDKETAEQRIESQEDQCNINSIN